MTTSPTFTEAVGPELLALTNWKRRLGYSDTQSFGSADGTFGDVVSACKDARIDTLGFTTYLWAYGVLVHDTRTPATVIASLIPLMSDAFIVSLKSTLAEQEVCDLARFSHHIGQACTSGRFDVDTKAHIEQVVFVLIRNYLAKVDGLDKADYSKPKPVAQQTSFSNNGYYR